MKVNINNNLYNEIKEFCSLNEKKDIEKEVNTILQTGFNVLRFGTSPFSLVKKEEKNERQENTIDEVKQSEEIKQIEPDKPRKKVRIIKN